MKLDDKSIEIIEKCLHKRIPIEIKQEKGQIVIVEVKRKVINKAQIYVSGHKCTVKKD